MTVQLTRREQQVLTLLNEGLSAKDIAEALGITTTTVSVHKMRIRDKGVLIGNDTRPELIDIGGIAFTRMQLRVLRGALNGLTDQQIADEAGITHQGVWSCAMRLRKKVGAKDYAELFQWARKVGLVTFHPVLAAPSQASLPAPVGTPRPSCIPSVAGVGSNYGGGA